MIIKKSYTKLEFKTLKYPLTENFFSSLMLFSRLDSTVK